MTSRTWTHSFRVAAIALAAGLVGSSVGLPTSAGATSAAPTAATTSSHFAPRSFTQSVYTPGEFFGGDNPSAQCFTCTAADVTGTAPPSQSLDAGAGVDNLTGDFTTSQPLFNAPALGADLSVALTYDAQLAQSELTAGTGGQPWGWGWSSGLSRAISFTDGPQNGAATVTLGSGAQVNFAWSPSSGTSTSCPSGDYQSTSMYTVSRSSSPVLQSGHQWCALANVKGQIGDVANSAMYFQTGGGRELDVFNWAGVFTNRTSSPGYGQSGYGLTYAYNVAPGTHPYGTTQNCPATATDCTVVYSADGRSVVEALNASNLTTELIDPAGNTYSFAYDTHGNLTSMTPYSNTASPGTWNYAYDTAQASPYSSDLVQVYDPDAGVGASPPVSPGAAHSTYVQYNYATTPGMVSAVEDGTGATTTYAYSLACATGACTNPGATQTTTVTFPAQVPCPSCTAAAPVETDVYASGVETSSTLGTSASGPNQETWQYAWTFGYGASNSTEQITYPHALSGTGATASITMDPAGSVIATTDALGNQATSAYNDSNGNIPPELRWSYPGPSSNPPNSPPPGSTKYTYNSFGQPLTATDPMGNVTGYAYYQNGSALCYVTPPTVTLPPSPSCSGSPWSGPYAAPVGSTAYTYDHQGDVSAVAVDYADTSTGADPQTWTASYDALGNQIWSISPAGQSGVQGPTNPYATVTSFTDANLPATSTPAGEGTTTYTYDAALNPTVVVGPAATVNSVYDADNRLCFQWTTNWQPGGLTCSHGNSGGTTAYTYLPGSTAVATVTDSNLNTTSYYYGDLAYPNAPTEIVDPMGNAVQYRAYDDYGNVCASGSVPIALGSSQCGALAGDTVDLYNALGDRTSTTDPSGNTTSFAYANSAFPTLQTSSTNPLGAVTGYSYDADGRLTTTTNPDLTKVTVGYDADSRVCVKADNGVTYGCAGGSGVTGVTGYTYNGANDRLSMVTYRPHPGLTSYSYASGLLTSTTDDNAKTVTYLYDAAGHVVCEGYPVSATTNCGTLASRQTGSPTNTIVNRTYDAAGRLTSLTDWLGNTTSYSYGYGWTPGSPSTITFPTSTGLTANYGYDNASNVSSLTAGTASLTTISDSWRYDANERVAVSTLNGSASGWTSYNANNQTTWASNLATSTSNDNYTVAANGSILSDVAPGPTWTTNSFGYNAGSQMCWSANTSSASSACASPPSGAGVLTNYAYTTNGQRSSATSTIGSTASTTNYAWNPFGQLCNVSYAGTTACGTTPTSGAGYTYNGDGLRTSSVANTPVNGTISAVSSPQDGAGTGVTTVAVSPQQVGDALVLSVSVASPTISVTAVSGGGSTWQKVTNVVDGHDIELWLGTVTTTGPSTVTVSFSGSVGSIGTELIAQEFTSSTGASTTWSATSADHFTNDGSSTAVAWPYLRPTLAGELYAGYSYVANTGSVGTTPGFTYDVTTKGNLFTYDPSVVGPVQPVATQSPAGNQVAVGALLRATGTSSTSTTTASTWDQVSGGTVPLDLNDATTTGSSTTTTSYLYGDLLFGGTAPIEQITTSGSTSSATFLVANQTGVQGVYSSTGSLLQMTLYSLYGVPTNTAGTTVTPFGYQGSYTDPTGLLYLVNRYYDPTTDQFLSVDPMVDQTGQPYVYVNDNPLNATDPLGLRGWYCIDGKSHYYKGDKYGKVGTGKCAITSERNIKGPGGRPAGSSSFTLIVEGTAKKLGDVQVGADSAILLCTATANLPCIGAGVALSEVSGATSTMLTCAAGDIGGCVKSVAYEYATAGLVSSAAGNAALDLGGVALQYFNPFHQQSHSFYYFY